MREIAENEGDIKTVLDHGFVALWATVLRRDRQRFSVVKVNEHVGLPDVSMRQSGSVQRNDGGHQVVHHAPNACPHDVGTLVATRMAQDVLRSRTPANEGMHRVSNVASRVARIADRRMALELG